MNEDLAKGVHIFHATTLSNCSQRVIFVATEKKIVWHSHPINLNKGEQLSERFLAVNAKGLVPVLVHDGHVVIESNEIIQYLESQFPNPTLQPQERVQQLEMKRLLERSDMAQQHIKLLTFKFLLDPMAKMSPSKLERYAQRQPDEALVAFHRKFSTTGFAKDEIERACSFVWNSLELLEDKLAYSSNLCGPDLSLADVSWVVNVHRSALLGFPLRCFPAVEQWLRRISKSSAYAQAVRGLEPPVMRAMFAAQVTLRRMVGADIQSYLNGAPLGGKRRA